MFGAGQVELFCICVRRQVLLDTLLMKGCVRLSWSTRDGIVFLLFFFLDSLSVLAGAVKVRLCSQGESFPG